MDVGSSASPNVDSCTLERLRGAAPTVTTWRQLGQRVFVTAAVWKIEPQPVQTIDRMTGASLRPGLSRWRPPGVRN